MERYDVAVIGAGPAGYVAAIYAARLGGKVAVVEKDRLGGTCLNRGCIPTKAILSSIGVLHTIKEAPSFGIEVNPPKVNFKKINERKDEIVKRLRQGIETLFKARKVSLFNGDAKVVGVNSIEVSGQRIEAKNIIIATGSVPIEIPVFKFNHKNILSSDDILGLTEIPEGLAIIGAGAIGCEFAAIYNSLGCKVTLVEMMPEILPGIDGEVAKKLSIILKKKGIEVLTGTKAEGLKEENGKVSLILSSGQQRLVDKVLVCVGRRPNSEGIGIEGLGINTERGRILADEHMRTNIPNIYAVGDVVGRFQLAHVASYEGIIACENIFGNKKKADYKSVPSCIYTEPEIGSVGFSEEKALEESSKAGLDIKIARFPFLSLGKAHVIAKTEGFIKLIGDKKTGRILGVHILGPEAANLISEAVLAIKQDLTVEELSDTIHAHPTLPEGLLEASRIFSEKGIHVL